MKLKDNKKGQPPCGRQKMLFHSYLKYDEAIIKGSINSQIWNRGAESQVLEIVNNFSMC